MLLLKEEGGKEAKLSGSSKEEQLFLHVKKERGRRRDSGKTITAPLLLRRFLQYKIQKYFFIVGWLGEEGEGALVFG